MREQFARQLYDLMRADDRILFITADLGYGIFDRIREFTDRFFNVGAAEQVMMDMAVGFALSGKVPVVYSITPFLIFRPIETIRLYIDKENIPVIMVGSGRGEDYSLDGFSHDASDHDILKFFKNIRFIEDETFDLQEIVNSGKPTYLNLKR
jgi:transketolase